MTTAEPADLSSRQPSHGASSADTRPSGANAAADPSRDHVGEAAASQLETNHAAKPASDAAPIVPDPGVASDAATGEQPPQWNIQPEPTDEELVALVTVLSLVKRQAAPAPGASPEGSRWARAGRVAALVPWSRVPGNGWGRGGPGQGQA